MKGVTINIQCNDNKKDDSSDSDNDNDTDMDFGEFAAMSNFLYPGLDESQIRRGFETADRDGDQEVSLDEIAEVIDESSKMSNLDLHIGNMDHYVESEVQRRFEERIRDLPKDCRELM